MVPSEQCTDLYIGETKPVHARMAQHLRANFSGQRRQMFERGVKEAVFVKLGKPSMNRGGSLRPQLAATHDAVRDPSPQIHNHTQHHMIIPFNKEN